MKKCSSLPSKNACDGRCRVASMKVPSYRRILSRSSLNEIVYGKITAEQIKIQLRFIRSEMHSYRITIKEYMA